MYPLLFVLYVVAEIAVLAWLGSTLGALATVLIFLGVSAAGYLVLAALGRRALRSLGELRAGRVPHASSPERVLTDGVLIGAGAALVLIPGIVGTVLGIVLLLPTRAALRPLVRTLVARRARTTGFTAQRLVVVDGQVVDHSVVGAAPRLTGGTAAPEQVDDRGTVLDGEIVETPRRREER
ncbi:MULTISPECIES: FxsA family protein [Rhodococcus]|uniref:FxsA family protein n=1 Tax=Rhodococcus TaxID=1827 RepID=UPI0020CD28F8|nr:FxsA family protein [Rhodococcus gordoniae]UTT46892.1 FxsA family protein [Rhodococcus gordoniae]